jgi:hypothetical protein
MGAALFCPRLFWRNDMSVKSLQEAIAYALINKNEQMAAALQAALDRLIRTTK